MLRAVGLTGDGEIGDLSGVDIMSEGDLRDRDGRAPAALAVEVEMLRANFGLTDREASMFDFWDFDCDG